MSLFAELSIIIGVAFAMSVVMTLLRQPLIIGHIITGLLVGPIIASSLSPDTFTLFSEIGIAILLFIVGINLSPKTIKEFGVVALITGVSQVVITSIVGYFLAKSIGFSDLTSLYIGVCLAFSSTIIILKLISDKGDIETLYAKISIGFLLVQDFIAITLLLIIPMISVGNSSFKDIGIVFGRSILLITLVLIIGFYFLPKINKFISKNIELLFLFAVVWGLGIASIFKFTGFSIEAGALIAGIALSNLPSRHEIIAKMTPLRDFFIIIFFILLGAHLTTTNISEIFPQAIIFSVLVLIFNPLILMIIVGILGYKKRTGLQTGFTVAQVSEFSLILMAMGVSFGQVDNRILSLITLVALITIFGSSYLVLYSDRIYKIIGKYLSVFERKKTRENKIEIIKYPIILFGGNRVGYDLIEGFKKMNKPFLVVDHDPENVEALRRQGINVDYGDAMDIDYLESLDLSQIELVVSTIPNSETNTLINNVVKSKNKNAIVVVVSHKIQDALTHYENGVDYVILPHFLGGQYASKIVTDMSENPTQREEIKEKHIKSLMARLSNGHEHPKIGVYSS
ncbi:MAG: cation:proton antiporter [Candidatus Zambryskibacteria bacterium]|nr:cation:proton antiporter [Candidatus Zambryskibacteria bacterium]